MSGESINRVQSLSDLRSLLTQDETGCRVFLYPKLNFGDLWWIPDEITGFSNKREKHPWVIVNGYSPRVASVTICPRSSSIRPKDLNRGLLTPANILPSLDKEGVLILTLRRAFPTFEFRDYEYIGRLPEFWIKKIHDFYKNLAGGKIGL